MNLPYHLIQRIVFALFGVSALTIKLPSIILGTLTILGIFILIKCWKRRNVAVLTTAIAVSSSQFLFMLQDGTPGIMFSFVVVWLLVASTYTTRSLMFTTFWKVVSCVLVATALYIPLGIYPVIALLITTSLHPHIRYVIRKVSRSKLIVAIVLGLVSISPLVYAVVLQPSTALTLLGIPPHIDLLQSVTTATLDLFGFFSASNGYFLRPLYPLGMTLIMCIGVYRLLTIKYTARSYTVLLLAVCLLPIIAINPTYTTALFPVGVILVGMGIATLIGNWYKLFPRNPYARIAGLVPISILVLGLVFTGVMRFMNNYTYNPGILSHYTTDLRLLSDTLATTKGEVVFVTSPEEKDFYTLVAHYNGNFNVSTDYEIQAPNLIVTSQARKIQQPKEPVTEIITNARAGESDRFYIYKTTVK